MKKEPFAKYEKETGRKTFVGTTQDEGYMRARLYARTGCNVYDGSTIKSQPLGFWTRQDVLRYVVENDIQICSVYGDIRQTAQGEYYCTKEQRTGCMFCAFGAHLEVEPNRFQRMATTHPRHYEICMNLENNGVKYRDALTTCKIPVETWEDVGQMNLWEYMEAQN